jgi:speckle-type POZ protein
VVESESGKVEIVDFKAKIVAKMVYFMYHDNLINKENVNSDLLILAEKYNIRGLINYCVKYLEENLSLENALDVLVSSHLTNQKRLFDAATKFAIENKGLLVKTESWKELLETNPKLANKIAMTMLELE